MDESKKSRRSGNYMMEIDYVALLRMMLNNIGLILLVGVACAMLAFTYKSRSPLTWTSCTKIYVLDRSDSIGSTINSYNLQSGTMLAGDLVQLVSSKSTMNGALETLGYEEWTASQLGSCISTSYSEDSRIISIYATSTDPVQAMKIADAVRDSASKLIKEVTDADAVNVVQVANLPTSPSGPNVKKTTAMGFLSGAFLVCAVLFVLYILDDSIMTSEDVEKFLGVSTLAMIPYEDGLEEIGSRKHRRKQSKKHKQKHKG